MNCCASENTEQPTCSICLEAATGDIRQLECNHRFHTVCYNNWARRCNGDVTCPNCRCPSADESGRQPYRRHIFNNDLRRNASMHSSGFERTLRGPEGMRDMTPGEILVMIFILTITLAVASICTSVSSACMCRLNWGQGQTYMIEKDFWGSQSVHTRPDLCVYIC